MISDTGIVLYDDDKAFEMLFKGFDISTIGLENNKFNEIAEKFDKLSEFSLDVHNSPLLSQRANEWLVELPDIDVRKYLNDLCKNNIEKSRINFEMDIYEERKLLDILKLMIFLVDHFRKNKIVWGVGRGSSCSSYVLYKIGIHKIDSIKYDLRIHDFLK